MNKAPDAFRTISEVADELDLPQHVLRFWESRFPQIKPMKRGGGRRYYRPDDVELLRGIRHLLYSDGYTIRGVQRILREQGIRTVQSVGQGEAVDLPKPAQEDIAEPEVVVHGERGVLEFIPPMSPSAGTQSRPPEAGAGAAHAELPEPESSEAASIENGRATKVAPESAAPGGTWPFAAAIHPGADETDNSVEPDDDVSAETTLPLFGGRGAVPAAPPAAPAPEVFRMPPEDLLRLEGVLHELEACKRMLEEALDDGD